MTHIRVRAQLLCAGAAFVALQGGAPAKAQAQAKPPESAVSDWGVDEVLVTAQKKTVAERLQDVPIAITALGPAQLERLKLKTLVDVASSVPGVSLGNNGPVRGVASFNIRGLGSSSNIASVEPAVGTFVDGVYLGTNYGIMLDTFDIEGIEVLRGPQGTLQGRNVTGGAVLIRTARPTDHFEVRSQASIETGPEYSVAASIGGPIVGDVVKAKLAGLYKKDEGWFHNDFDNRDVGRERTWFVRPTIVITPNDRFEQTFILERGAMRADGAVSQNGADPTLRRFALNYNEVGYTKLDWNSVTSETNLKVALGGGVVTNLFNYRAVLQDSLFDTDGSTASFFHMFVYLDQEQYSNELRYAGNFGEKVQLTTGIYYFHQDYMYLEHRLLSGGLIDRTLGGHIDQDGYGIFAQSDIKLTGTLTATLGVRYSSERKSAEIDPSPSGLGASNCSYATKTCPLNNLPTFVDSKRWDAWTPKLSLNWKPSRDLLVYGTWSKGVRNGGYNVRSSSQTVAPGPYGQETQNAYELGFKSDLYNRRVRFNGAVSLSQLVGLQRDVTVLALPPEIGVVQVVRNAADADIVAAEGELVFAPHRDLQLSVSVGYTNADYKKVLFDLTGDNRIDDKDLALEPPRLSRWTVGVGGNWTRPLTETLKATVNVNYGYRSPAAINDANTLFVGPRNMLVASLAVAWPENRLELSVYGRNLLNESRESTRVPISAGVPPYQFRGLEEGRVLGVQVKGRF